MPGVVGAGAAAGSLWPAECGAALGGGPTSKGKSAVKFALLS